MNNLILIRHGQSVWNAENKFTGWVDVDISSRGREEAINAANTIKNKSLVIDHVFCSSLIRAINTADIILKDLNSSVVPLKKWQLNERHYGSLQGKNKAETSKIYGDKMVNEWRRSYDIPPPKLTKSEVAEEKNKANFTIDAEHNWPASESLKNTFDRVISFWKDEIEKKFPNKNVLIVAHGNTIRSIVKYIENISDKNIVKVEISTGQPLIYEYNNSKSPLNKYFKFHDI
jgi:2,3-bisphosphoglycerate-dependent phosphoglycerate mutase